MPEPFDFAEEEPKNQTGLKIVAGGLALLLVIMNVWPQDDSDSHDSASASETDATVSADAGVSADAVSKPPDRRIVWPNLPLADVIRSNPFRRESVPAEAVDTVESDSDRDSETNDAAATANTADPPVPRLDVSKYPVRFVFRGPQGGAAMIRDKVYYEGDSIDGMQIVRIAEDGVTLQLLPSPSSDDK
ncbi:MAG: hypothetical protein RIK87_00285 [Fuerstiella sp.]